MMPSEWFWQSLTALIAAWAGWSAWMQHKVARDKLRLDLFEKRAAVFEAVKDVLIAAHDRGEADFPTLQRAALSATFLFGNDVGEYLKEVSERLTELQNVGCNVRAALLMYPTSRNPAHVLLVKWLDAQPQRVIKVFTPYLSFAAVRVTS